MKVLVAYFSRSGNTQLIADRIATALGARVERITESSPRERRVGYWRALAQAVFGRNPPICDSVHNPRNYDLVIIGTPIWALHLSPPVRAYAQRHAGSIGRVAFFCTTGGVGAFQAFTELERIVDRHPIATLSLAEREMSKRRLVDRKLAVFVESVHSHPPGRLNGSTPAPMRA